MWAAHSRLMHEAEELRAQQEDVRDKLEGTSDTQRFSCQRLVNRLTIPADYTRDDLVRLGRELWYMPRACYLAGVASVAHMWTQLAKAALVGSLFDALSQLPPVTTGTGSIDVWNFLSVARLHALGRIVLLLFLCAGLETALCVAKEYFLERAKAARLLATRPVYLRVMLSQDLPFHAANTAAELAQRLYSDPESMDDFVVYSFERALRGITALMTLYWLIRIDAPLICVAILLRLPWILQFIEFTARIVANYERLQTNAKQKAQSRATELLANVPLIQAHTAEESETRAYANLLDECCRVYVSGAFVCACLRQVSNAITLLADVIILSFGAYRIASGYMSMGLFTQFRSNIGVFQDHFMAIESLWMSIRRTIIQSQRYHTLLQRRPLVGPPAVADVSLPLPTVALLSADEDAPTDSSDDAMNVASAGDARSRTSSPAAVARRRVRNPRTPTLNGAGVPAQLSVAPTSAAPVKGCAVVFDNVSFAYPRPLRPSGAPTAETDGAAVKTLVLSNITLTCRPGEVIALVGRSGGGKSSLARLLMGFYPPNEGRILVDDADVTTMDPRALRHAVCMVDQDVTLLARSVWDNLTLGCDVCPTHEAVTAAARAAYAHDFIQALPQGYDTSVGDRGSRLSGGQRQRIAIARALLRNPRVLILDESTSALDAEAEAVVTAALGHLMKGRTCIVIAHRLASIQRADRIHVFSEGRVVQTGTHQSLLKEPDGLYASLVRHQSLDAASSVAAVAPAGVHASASGKR